MAETTEFGVRIRANGDEAAAVLKNLSNEFKQTANHWKNMFVGALGFGGFTEGMKHAIDHAEELQKQAKKLNIEVGHLSALQITFEQAGGSASELNRAMMMLQYRLTAVGKETNEHKNPFAFLGKSLAEVKGMKPEQMLYNLADAYQQATKNSDEHAKAVIAGILHMRGMSSVLPTLAQGSAHMRAMGEQWEKIGATTTGPFAKAAEEFKNSFNLFKHISQEQIFGAIGEPFVKDVTRAVTLLTSLSWMKDIGTELKSATGTLGDIVGSIFSGEKGSVADVFKLAGDSLVGAGMELVDILKDGLVSAADLLGDELLKKHPWLQALKTVSEAAGAAAQGIGAYAAEQGAKSGGIDTLVHGGQEPAEIYKAAMLGAGMGDEGRREQKDALTAQRKIIKDDLDRVKQHANDAKQRADELKKKQDDALEKRKEEIRKTTPEIDLEKAKISPREMLEKLLDPLTAQLKQFGLKPTMESLAILKREQSQGLMPRVDPKVVRDAMQITQGIQLAEKSGLKMLKGHEQEYLPELIKILGKTLATKVIQLQIRTPDGASADTSFTLGGDDDDSDVRLSTPQMSLGSE